MERNKKLKIKAEPRRRRRVRWGVRGSTIRDWLPIVAAFLIPLVVALGTWRITVQQGNLEDDRAKAEQARTEQRLQDETLQTYLSQMGTLMLEEDLRDSEKGSEVRKLARARTLTTLERLDASHKTEAAHFLIEAGLVSTYDAQPPPVSLIDADLSGTDLWGAGFTGAHLEQADLSGADLRRAELSDAWLVFTDLRGADLENADLTGVHLHVVDFSGADLRGAMGITGQELADYGCKLEGTTLPDGRTMPSGQAYEDLIKAGKEGK
jgi:uncharacterized protein YjbI with pentapeptide repeats